MNGWISYGAAYFILVSLSMLQLHTVLELERTGLSVRIIHAARASEVERNLRSRSMPAGKSWKVTPAPLDKHLTPVRLPIEVRLVEDSRDDPMDLNKGISAASALLDPKNLEGGTAAPSFEAGSVGAGGSDDGQETGSETEGGEGESVTSMDGPQSD